MIVWGAKIEEGIMAPQQNGNEVNTGTVAFTCTKSFTWVPFTVSARSENVRPSTGPLRQAVKG